MKTAKTLTTILSLLVLVYSCSEKKKTQEILFQENTDDWFVEGDASWEFVNNVLVGTAKDEGGFVMTKKSYSDFVLELEFYPDSTVNSGIFIRCKGKELSHNDCYEINIWDLHPSQENRTGAVVSRASPIEKIETLNKWSTYRIKNEGDHLQVWINDIMMVDIKDHDLKEGPIALQAYEEGVVKFRNIRILTLN